MVYVEILLVIQIYIFHANILKLIIIINKSLYFKSHKNLIIKHMQLTQLIILIAIGLVAGIVAGSLGVGGGVIIVPCLVFFLGYSQHQAQGTSIAFMIPPIGILAAYNYHKQGFIEYKTAIIITFTFVIGAYLGSLLSVNIPDKILRKIFGIFMLFIALKMIFSK